MSQETYISTSTTGLLAVRLEYWDEEEQRYERYEFDYPTDKELLTIFPEAKDIIPLKIKEAQGEQLIRLKKMENLMNPQTRSQYDKWDLAFQDAKSKPIQELYKFKRLRRTGRGYEACCPFHNDKAPSLVIYPDNKFRCFGCQKTGDAIDFMRMLHDVDVRGAVNLLNAS